MSMKSLGPIVGGVLLLGGTAYAGYCIWENRAKVKSMLQISGAIPTLTDAQFNALNESGIHVRQGTEPAGNTYGLTKAQSIVGPVAANATVAAGYFFSIY